MSLKLESIHIKNYKSCVDIQLDLAEFTPLIGYNNAGKSNCLSAIQWLLRKQVLSNNDFNDMSAKISIEGIITGISDFYLNAIDPKHSSKIKEYISNDNTLRIKREQLTPNCKVGEIKLYVWDENANDWAVNPTGIDNALGSLLPEPIRIGAMENAAEDSSKAKTSTTIGKLLALLTDSVRKKHEKILDEYLEKVRGCLAHDGADRFGELKTIDLNINEKIQNFFPDVSIKLHFDTPTFDELIKAGTIKVFEENIARDFSSYGHGTQRSIQMALVQCLSEYKSNNTSTTILLIDEPELYLHPFAIEQIRAALINLSLNGYQIVVSTHSAQMITPELAEHALLIRKLPQGSGTSVRKQLKKAVKQAITDTPHQAELIFTLSHSSQVLFSDKVLLTEGKTELRLLPFIFNLIHGKTLGQNKYALISQGGVDNTGKTLLILKNMDIPSKAICDLDYAFRGAVQSKFLDENDVDLVNCKKAMSECATSYDIIIGDNGLPTKENVGSTSKAYELLASDESVIPYIERLHSKLKNQKIWLWKKGAIEAHLGLKGKKETEWSQFRDKVKSSSLETVCPDYVEIKKLVEWILED